MTQIDGTRRLVYIKFTDIFYVQDILRKTNGTNVYKHASGEIFTVRLEIVGMGKRRTRIANLLRKSREAPYALHSPSMGKSKKYTTKLGPKHTDTRWPMESRSS
jgi:hypothetical protein